MFQVNNKMLSSGFGVIPGGVSCNSVYTDFTHTSMVLKLFRGYLNNSHSPAKSNISNSGKAIWADILAHKITDAALIMTKTSVSLSSKEPFSLFWLMF